MSIEQAFNNFMSNDFQAAVDSSTKAYYSGGGYSVELFDDGTYRVLPTPCSQMNNSIGNGYKSPGILLNVPALNDSDWDEDPSVRFYDNAADTIRVWFKWSNLYTMRLGIAWQC